MRSPLLIRRNCVGLALLARVGSLSSAATDRDSGYAKWEDSGFDELLAYYFDTFVGGHLTDIGSKKDVEITKEFTYDVYNTVKRTHNHLDQTTVAAEAAETVGSDN